MSKGAKKQKVATDNPKKGKTAKDKRIAELEALLAGGAAPTPPRKKTWNILDMKALKPLNENQSAAFDAYRNGKQVILGGSAGAGKSTLAAYFALHSVLNGDQKQVIIVRTTVEARGMGFLPGTEEEKLSPYERPYREALGFLFGRSSTYDDMKEAGLVAFESTAFLRSVTHNDSVVIFDECQNSTFEELYTVATRLGKNSRVIFIGDIMQNDLYMKKEKSGFPEFLEIMALIPEDFEHIKFTSDDVVRSGLVKRIIKAVERHRGIGR
ncbi:PhoH-like ATPase protein [Achromobacter phage Motura]|uniref:PhoH-like protein n=1 Tax=Achromobacter phage Motura TaxID=2591403 RepID=A0A514CSG5_9CAUD|nr:PhoH-like phosphate starvation-inducible [Achromobacter phage Motura]QDH83409.1 PhoH-like ATPase protein [Achromobacter phage Motura]